MTSERIFVALSGGVDSAVSAALLQEQGYNVEGIYMKYASESVMDFVNTARCSWQDDIESVEAIGRHLGIPVRSINVEREYDEFVISNFLHEYSIGRTPNPDVLCNRDIKFGYFLQWAQKQGIRNIATGHYAQIAEINGKKHLQVGADENKDQSYFLYTLSHEILSHVLFPIGHLQKKEVRALAETFGLPNAQRPDSQGVCFIGDMDVRTFLQSRTNNRPGPIVTTSGQTIGSHSGLSPFTIGQRHGFGIGGGSALYVIEKNIATNELVVGPNDDPRLYADSLVASNIFMNSNADAQVRCQARIRYRQPLAWATVTRISNDRVLVTFDEPQRAVAPGQAIVFYTDNGLVLGGATIDNAQLKEPHGVIHRAI